MSLRNRTNLPPILFPPTPQIIMPAVMAPALMVLFWADIKAKKLGVLSIAASSYDGRVKGKGERLSWWQLTRNWWIQIDAVGLILLGVGWALVLLPFTLYKRAEGGWGSGRQFHARLSYSLIRSTLQIRSSPCSPLVVSC